MTLNDVKRAFMWNLGPIYKVWNVEVVSCNGIIQNKWMIDLRLIGWNYIILILMKVMMSFLPLLWGIPSGPLLGRVNVIGLWTWYGTLLYEPYMWITLWEQKLEPSEYGKGSSSCWRTRRAYKAHLSYSLTMCLHGMCPSSTTSKWNTLIEVGWNSRFHALLPWSMSFIVNSHHMGYRLALESFYEVYMVAWGHYLDICTIGFEGVSGVSRSWSYPRPLLEFPLCDEWLFMN